MNPIEGDCIYENWFRIPYFKVRLPIFIQEKAAQKRPKSSHSEKPEDPSSRGSDLQV